MKILASSLIAAFLAFATAGISAAAAPQKNLLQNGDFESGGREKAIGWMQSYPPQIQIPKPKFTHPDDLAHGGDSCGAVKTHKTGGYSSYAQKVRGDDKADLARFSGWVKIDEMEAGSSASLMLLFLDADGKMISLHRSRPLAKTGDWELLEVEVVVPDDAQDWMVRCGVLGKGEVAFDDVELIGAKVKGEHITAQMAVHFGTYVVRTSSAKKAPWIGLSIPFPFERQTPLAIRVTSEPPDMVNHLQIYEEHDNRPLRVVLKKTKRGAEIKLRIETLTMVADRPLSDGAEIPLANPRKVPKEIRQHLKAAPGVDAKEKSVKAAADGFDKADFASLMLDLNEYLKQNLKYDGGRTQGAKECLESGKAVCTGFANVAASLLIAADVPTRILACTQLSGRLQEHYIVEAWAPKLGWSRLESTMAKFPWADSNNLILRVVYPDSNRSTGDVPLFVETGGGGSGGFDMDPADTCWQGADQMSGLLVSQKSFTKVEQAARESFHARIKKPAEGNVARFAPDAKQAKKLKLDERALRLIAAVDRWLD